MGCLKHVSCDYLDKNAERNAHIRYICIFALLCIPGNMTHTSKSVFGNGSLHLMFWLLCILYKVIKCFKIASLCSLCQLHELREIHEFCWVALSRCIKLVPKRNKQAINAVELSSRHDNRSNLQIYAGLNEPLSELKYRLSSSSLRFLIQNREVEWTDERRKRARMPISENAIYQRFSSSLRLKSSSQTAPPSSSRC